MATYLILLLPAIIGVAFCREVNNDNGTVSSVISRDHVTVWFDYNVRYYGHEPDNAYSKEEIAVMVDLVSTRFRKIVLDPAPAEKSFELTNLNPKSNEGKEPRHSLTLVPSVVAEHNVKFPEMRMEVYVTFFDTIWNRYSEKTSFEVALEIAKEANEICNGTVTTLMMDARYFDLNFLKETTGKLNEAEGVEFATSNPPKFRYKLVVLLKTEDCGPFKGPLGQNVKDALPYVSTFVFLVEQSPKFRLGRNYNAEVVHNISVLRFEECERKVKAENKDVKLVPAVSVLPPVDLKENWAKEFVRGWELMSQWAEKNDREVIMLKAFDSLPQYKFEHGDESWWRLKNRAQYEITKDSFIEKISEVNLTSTWSDNGDGIADEEYSSDEYFVGREVKEYSIPGEVYFVLLLTVVCSLVVVVVAGLVLRSNNKRLQSHLKGRFDTNGQQAEVSPSYGESLYGESGANGISSVEFSDTSPIVSVTYKKDNWNEQ